MMNELNDILDGNTPWEEPILFDATAGSDIPADLLPEPFSTFAKELIESTETPESMATLVILGILSLILCRKYKVAIKDDHSQSLNLYIFIVMLSGNRKSSVLKAASEPILKWEQLKKKEMSPIIEQAVSKYKTIQAIIDKKRKKADDINAAYEIADLEKQLPKIPILPQLFLTDTTPESLRSKLIQHSGYMGIVTDEGGVIDVIAGLYNKGNANIDIFLNGIEGGHVRVARKDEEVFVCPYLTFVLVVQPVVFASMAEKKSFAGRGFLERFLYCIPQTKLGYRTHDTKPVSQATKEQYEEAIIKLLNIPDKVVDGIVEHTMLYAEQEAMLKWKKFQIDGEKELRPNGSLASRTGWGSKLPDFVFRIAAILYVAKHYDKLDGMKQIDKQSMQDAIKMGHKLIEHSNLGFDSILCDAKTIHARELWEWIKSNGAASLKRSEITYGIKNRNYGKADELDKLLEELKRRHLVHERVEATAGRSSTVYDVNPKAISKEV